MNDYHQPLLPDNIYHLFSRAVGSEKLFKSSANYLFFLQKLKQHTSAVCKIYCYTLLPNHFHILVRISDEAAIVQHFQEVKNRAFQPSQHDISDFIMERFSNFLNSYTKAFNKMYNRKGALFMDYIKRSSVNAETDFTSYIWYIHKNAVHHRLAKEIGEWEFDSYASILSDAPTSLLREQVIEWYGNKCEFIKFHQQPDISKVIKDI
ncbi:MAG: hypothetical protein M3Z26_12970 [Bacteroidota bacterium]|nr:hypothetical protein [Bacteroidota bacterium]